MGWAGSEVNVCRLISSAGENETEAGDEPVITGVAGGGANSAVPGIENRNKKKPGTTLNGFIPLFYTKPIGLFS